MPDVSVITVTFNPVKAGRAGQLSECIASVRAQRGLEVEHLIIDGGSSDGTLALLEEESGKGSLRYISEKDSGIYDAMNKGARLGSGEYLAFLNSDDFYFRDDALAMAAAALRQSCADYCCAECRIIGGGKHRLRRVRMDTVLWGMPYCHQSFIIRRDVFLRCGGYDASLRIAADYDLALRLFLSGVKGIELPEAFAAIRAGGVSSDRGKARAEAAAIVRRAYSPCLGGLSEAEAADIVTAAKFPDGLLEKLLEGRPENFCREVKKAARRLRFRAWRRNLAGRLFGGSERK